MRRKIEWKWEILDGFTKRAKVIGGWVLEFGIHSNKGSVSNAMVFVADRDHEWEIAKPFDPSDPGKQRPKLNADDFAGSTS